MTESPVGNGMISLRDRWRKGSSRSKSRPAPRQLPTVEVRTPERVPPDENRRPFRPRQGGRRHVAHRDRAVYHRTPVADRPQAFTGGPLDRFIEGGREQLAALLDFGLTPYSTLADLGCGALRGGMWLIPLLDTRHYCGVEPNRGMVERGLRDYLDPAVVALREPRFSFNDQFDLSEFDTEFTHMLLRSVWTHATKPQIEQCLDAFAKWATPDGVMLASRRRIGVSLKPLQIRLDYKGSEWMGRSHQSDVPGRVAHSMRWIRSSCEARGLQLSRVRRPALGHQHWVAVRRR